MPAFSNAQQVVIEDSGSTNRPGLRVSVDQQGHATVEPRFGETRKVQLSQQLCDQLMRDLKQTGPLSELPARHCVKSVSFGSSLFVEYGGHRSPDLTCPAAEDSPTIALKKDAQDILQAAREAAGVPNGRLIRMPIQNPPKS